MTSCWKPPTSSRTAILWGSRSFPTASLCKLHHAAFDRYLIGVTPDLEVTVRLDVLEDSTGQSRRTTSARYRAPSTSSPIATSWPSATPSSAARAEQLYPFGAVDTKYPQCVEWRHGFATAQAQARNAASCPRRAHGVQLSLEG